MANMSRTFVIGDIHGAYKALLQCFQRAGFDYGKDRLISLGDVCDGWPEVDKVFDELDKIDRLVYIIGNHDEWALQWHRTGESPFIWLSQGGNATIGCYPDGIPDHHLQMLNNAYTYYIEDNQVFTHGGFHIGDRLENQEREVFIWDRSLVDLALNLSEHGEAEQISSFTRVFIGHTPTLNYHSEKPIKACEVWMMDTGAGWYGRLSIMNLETEEVFQSDPVPGLYPGYSGRMIPF